MWIMLGSDRPIFCALVIAFLMRPRSDLCFIWERNLETNTTLSITKNQHVQNQSLILKKSKNYILLILRSFGWEIPKSEVGAPKLVLWWIDKVLLKFLHFVFQRLSWHSWSLIAIFCILSYYHVYGELLNLDWFSVVSCFLYVIFSVSIRIIVVCIIMFE